MVATAVRATVVLTGVSRGLGEAMALELLARGCRVIGVGRASSPRLAHPDFGVAHHDSENIFGQLDLAG